MTILSTDNGICQYEHKTGLNARVIYWEVSDIVFLNGRLFIMCSDEPNSHYESRYLPLWLQLA